MIQRICYLAEEFYCAIHKIAKKPSGGILFYCPEDHTVFLTHRSSHMSSPNTWDLPGGRPKDEDKSSFMTAIREVYEEIGIIPKNKIPIKTHDIKTDQHHYVVYIIPLSVAEKEKFNQKLNLNHENDKVNWFDYDSIPTDTHFDLSWIESEIS